jgi:hypothetical protein
MSVNVPPISTPKRYLLTLFDLITWFIKFTQNTVFKYFINLNDENILQEVRFFAAPDQ